MGAVMNPPSTSDTPDRRKGRWQLILILMMVIGPMVLATANVTLRLLGAGLFLFTPAMIA